MRGVKQIGSLTTKVNNTASLPQSWTQIPNGLSTPLAVSTVPGSSRSPSSSMRCSYQRRVSAIPCHCLGGSLLSFSHRTAGNRSVLVQVCPSRGKAMPRPALYPVWHVICSQCVLAITAVTLSTIGVAAQPAQNVAAQPEAAAASPAAALAYLGTVSGGFNNTVSGVAATIGGGFGNTASGYFATVGGGFGNIAAGTGSFVAGSNALNDTPAHIGSFLFADNSGYPFHSAAANEFAARATGGVRFVLGIDGSGTPTWSCAASNGNNWACSSDRNLKENFQPVDVAD